MSTEESPIIIRKAREEDKNFILDTFLKGLYYGDSWFTLIPKRIFMDNYRKAAQTIVSLNYSSINVACLQEDENLILGYAIINKDQDTLHWVFVKTLYRKLGLAKKLVPNTVDTVTHLTNLGKILLPKINNVTFNPFKIP